MVPRFVGALALVTALASVTPGDVERPGDWALAEDRPDPSQAVELDRWPN